MEKKQRICASLLHTNLLLAGHFDIWPQRGDKLYICVNVHKETGAWGEKHSNNSTEKTMLGQN